MSSSIPYHFEWFRRELERCVCDDDNDERTQHVMYLLDIMQQRILSASAATVPTAVVAVDAEPRVDEEVARSPVVSITPGVHRIVDGRVTRTPIHRLCPNNAHKTWHLVSPHPFGWSHAITKRTSRYRH